MQLAALMNSNKFKTILILVIDRKSCFSNRAFDVVELCGPRKPEAD